MDLILKTMEEHRRQSVRMATDEDINVPSDDGRGLPVIKIEEIEDFDDCKEDQVGC